MYKLNFFTSWMSFEENINCFFPAKFGSGAKYSLKKLNYTKRVSHRRRTSFESQICFELQNVILNLVLISHHDEKQKHFDVERL